MSGPAAPKNRIHDTTLVNTPSTSSVDLDVAPQTSSEESVDILAGLRLMLVHVESDIDRGTLDIHDGRIKLCVKELELLGYLVKNADRTVSCEGLYDTVWHGSGSDSPSCAIDAHIRCLRKKIEDAPKLITTLRGQGYRFNSAPGVRAKSFKVHTLAARSAQVVTEGPAREEHHHAANEVHKRMRGSSPYTKSRKHGKAGEEHKTK